MNDQTVVASGRPGASLVVREGIQAGTMFPLTGDVAILGREEGTDISIHDPEVSRRHARISWQAGRFILEDLGSTNGTYLNGVQIASPQPVQPGDEIGIGQTMLVFQAQAEAAPAPPVAASTQPVPPPSPDAMPAEQKSGGSRCLLWGCGCVILLGLLLAIAAVAAMVLFAEEIQPIFDEMGIPIQLVMLYVTRLFA